MAERGESERAGRREAGAAPEEKGRVPPEKAEEAAKRQLKEESRTGDVKHAW